MKRAPDAVLITGSSRRLGFAFVKKSLAMGLSVVAHYHTGTHALGSWLRKNPRARQRVHLLRADLSADPGELIDRAATLPVRLAGLVNNASIFTRGDLTSARHFADTMATNLHAPLALAREFHRVAGTGWIINVTDAHVRPAHGPYQNYRLSKLWLSELTGHLAFVLAPKVRVNGIAPGPVLPPPGRSAAYLRSLARKTPLGRPVPVGCVMNAYAFLVENGSVTGQIIYADSGWHLGNQP
ncbi:MAG: SDR family oxidoreductase [Chitinivibrionales bacterium]|nr:SDR family oxidoreductase [Chitinivibrionales bacterium]MBD3395512.1 SDR family oxidoreductase [Chitinivibrionales bacterium]